MKICRLFRHIVQTRLGLHRRFPAQTLDANEAAVHRGELRHDGEVRFAVEAELDLPALWRDQTPRERALEVFAHLGVWDTAHNKGVLVYVLLADRAVEIVADRGFNGRVPQETWERICHAIELECRQGHYEQGICRGISAIHDLIAEHFPVTGSGRNELPDRPVLL